MGDDTRPLIPHEPGAHAITAGSGQTKVYAHGSEDEGSDFYEVLLEGLDRRADTSPIYADEYGNTKSGDGIITKNELVTYLESEFKRRGLVEKQIPDSDDIAQRRSLGSFYFLRRGVKVTRGAIEGSLGQGTPFGETDNTPTSRQRVQATEAQKRMMQAKNAAEPHLIDIKKHALSDYESALNWEEEAHTSKSQATLEGYQAAEDQYSKATNLFEEALAKTINRLRAPSELRETVGPAFENSIENSDIDQLAGLFDDLKVRDRKTFEQLCNENDIRNVDVSWRSLQFIEDGGIKAEVRVDIFYRNRRNEPRKLPHDYVWWLSKENGTWIIVEYDLKNQPEY
jgi:hypothetical protein